jgi:hypothetical protein
LAFHPPLTASRQRKDDAMTDQMTDKDFFSTETTGWRKWPPRS